VPKVGTFDKIFPMNMLNLRQVSFHFDKVFHHQSPQSCQGESRGESVPTTRVNNLGGPGIVSELLNKSKTVITN
jgi:hypothetical protein